LVSALSFFHTGDENGAHGRRPAAAKPARQAAAAPARAVKPNGHAPAAKAAGKSGVNLRLNDKHDEMDAEFERY
jgi:hypothetical protein